MPFLNQELNHLLKELNFDEYLRRSSKDNEDKQIRSLEGQEEDLNEVIKNYGLTIQKVFKESQTAFEPGRPLFNEMITRIEKGETNAVLIWHPNRIARNYEDGGKFVQLMSEGNLRLVLTPYSVFQNNPRDKEYLMTEFTRATRDSDDKSEAVKRGNRIKLKAGYIPSGRLPEGYIHVKNKKSEIINDVDPERFPMLQKAVKLILSGTYTPMEALNSLNNKWGYRTGKTKRMGGNPMSKSTWYKLLTNPIYCGDLSSRKSANIEQKASFPSLITREEFDKLQIVLGRKGKPHVTKHEFPYKSVLTCGECGGSITAEEKWQIICPNCKTKFNKSKKRDTCPECNTLIEDMENPKILHYVYYHCTKRVNENCTQGSIRLKKLEERIDEELKKFEISKRFKKWAIEYLNELNDTETHDREDIRKNLEGARDACIKRIDNLVKLKISPQNTDSSVISDDEYDTQRKLILSEKESVERQLKEVDRRINKWHEISVKTFKFACYARYWFAKGDVKTKTGILNTLGSNLMIKDRGLLIDGHKAFFLIEKGKREVEELAQKFEPGKNIDLIEKIDHLEPMRSAWLAG